MFEFGSAQAPSREGLALSTYTSIALAVWKRKRVLIGCIAFGVASSIGACVFLTPVYEASTSLVVGQTGGDGDMWESIRRSGELATSHARVAESDEVIRAAIERVGLAALDLQSGPKANALDWLLASLRPNGRGQPIGAASDLSWAVAAVRGAISVSTETRSYIIKISFRSTSPATAAEFANALAQAFIDRQIELSNKPGSVEFFKGQAAQFKSELEQSSIKFEAFVTKHKAYSIDEQRALLLKRSSEFVNGLSSTRSSLASKQGEKQALVAQLKLLKPVTLSPFVYSIVTNLASEDKSALSDPRSAPAADRQQAGGDAPLLMVKVYQDLMVALFRINSEMSGLHDLAKQQQSEISTIDTELLALANNERQFEKLRRDMRIAAQNVEVYAKRAVEEQIAADSVGAKLSSVKIIQPARVPLQAVFPNKRLLILLGSAMGLGLGLALILLLERPFPRAELAARKTGDQAIDAPGADDTEQAAPKPTPKPRVRTTKRANGQGVAVKSRRPVGGII